MTNPNPQSTASMKIIDHNDEIFSNTLANDLVFYINSEQSMHLGPYNFENPSILTLKNNKVTITGLLQSDSIDTKVIETNEIHASNIICQDFHTDTLHSDQVGASNITSKSLFSDVSDIAKMTANEVNVSKLNSSNTTMNEVHIQNANIINASCSNVIINAANIMNSSTFNQEVEKNFICRGDASMCNVDFHGIVNIHEDVNLDGFMSFSVIP
jgi:hypothetical protein